MGQRQSMYEACDGFPITCLSDVDDNHNILKYLQSESNRGDDIMQIESIKGYKSTGYEFVWLFSLSENTPSLFLF